MIKPPLPAVRRRFREDGWSPEVQRDFIEALAESGSVALAAQHVNRSASTAYRLRARPDAHVFRAAWQAATDLAYRQLHELAMDRIVNGVEAPVLYKGEHCYQKTVYSDRLLMFMLGHLRPERPAAAGVPELPPPADGSAMTLALAALDAANAPVIAAREAAARLTQRRAMRQSRLTQRAEAEAGTGEHTSPA